MSLSQDDIVTKLKLVRAYIEKGWTQNWYARDAAGYNTGPWSPNAVCWCIRGAIHRACNREGGGFEIEKILLDNVGAECMSLAIWNDKPGRTKNEVLDLIDKAIQESQQGVTR